MLVTVALQVVLAIQPTPLVSPAALAHAVREAARIWAPHDVIVVVRTGSSESISPDATSISVQPASVLARPQHGWLPLGLIDVDASGVPMPTVAVNYAELVRLVGGLRFLGKREWQWSPAMRDELIGRALGRVLAHELGHFLLSSRRHSRAGLMRAQHGIAELASAFDSPYRLDTADRQRLDAMRHVAVRVTAR